MQPLFTPVTFCSVYGGLAGNSETTFSIAKPPNRIGNDLMTFWN
jgi:hypothetical protein